MPNEYRLWTPIIVPPPPHYPPHPTLPTFNDTGDMDTLMGAAGNTGGKLNNHYSCMVGQLVCWSW